MFDSTAGKPRPPPPNPHDGYLAATPPQPPPRPHSPAVISPRTSTAAASCMRSSCGVAAAAPLQRFSSRSDASGVMSAIGIPGGRSTRRRERREVAGCIKPRSHDTCGGGVGRRKWMSGRCGGWTLVGGRGVRRVYVRELRHVRPGHPPALPLSQHSKNIAGTHPFGKKKRTCATRPPP
eukprot:scaffold13712_cov124-Isochrysis_galbana.AAC.2